MEQRYGVLIRDNLQNRDQRHNINILEGTMTHAKANITTFFHILSFFFACA